MRLKEIRSLYRDLEHAVGRVERALPGVRETTVRESLEILLEQVKRRSPRYWFICTYWTSSNSMVEVEREWVGGKWKEKSPRLRCMLSGQIRKFKIPEEQVISVLKRIGGSAAKNRYEYYTNVAITRPFDEVTDEHIRDILVAIQLGAKRGPFPPGEERR